MFFTLASFFLALLLLITIHEYGHFLVARLCKVKVLRFSFGFGKVLASFYDKKGTEYSWSLLPLGGYVKMLDENEDEVLPEERHLAFNNKSVWARMAIIVAGPLFNLLFAFIAFWLVQLIGLKSLAPIVGEVKKGSIAAEAGINSQDEIISFNEKPIHSWRDLQFVLMPLVGTTKAVNVELISRKTQEKKELTLALETWQLDSKKADVLESLGIIPYIPQISPIVGTVLKNSPAFEAGLSSGDVIKELNGKAVNDWFYLADYTKKHPNERINLKFLHQGQLKELELTIGQHLVKGKEEGFLGLASQKVDWPKDLIRLQREGPIQALATALHETISLTGATFSFIGRFISGKLALDNISGPIGIAHGAGESARGGLSYYLSFLALVSISLAVLNLLPIPMLDGGHLLYCLIELVKGKPLSQSLRTIGIYFGLFFLIGLTILALTNDLSRLANS
ncbi:MAG: RIP metalloprotease RseP [Proteobacteria bacterium]|nr:RIP metalloprotease RseP [Pseudomonadota bacterium]